MSTTSSVSTTRVLQNLIIAENRHAVAFAGFGHCYPTLEVYSKAAEPMPWLQTAEEQRACPTCFTPSTLRPACLLPRTKSGTIS